MSAATLMGGLSPAQWRTLNALFYGGSGGRNVLTLRTTQRVEWQQLVALEDGEFITAWLGSKTQVKLADMSGSTHVLRIHPTDPGIRKVTGNRPNQVICLLGGRPNHSAPVRDLKGEGMADDDLLLEMGAAGLVGMRLEPGADLSAFKRLPRDLVLRLTATGRAYFPARDGRGAGMSGVNHVHEGATEQWSPAAELAAVGQSPELVPAWVDDPDPDGLAEIAANLDAIETRTVLALDEAVDRALTQLESTR